MLNVMLRLCRFDFNMESPEIVFNVILEQVADSRHTDVMEFNLSSLKQTAIECEPMCFPLPSTVKVILDKGFSAEQNLQSEVMPISTMQLAEESNGYSVLPSQSIELNQMLYENEEVPCTTTEPFVTDCKPESSLSMLEMSDNYELGWYSEDGLKPLLKPGKN